VTIVIAHQGASARFRGNTVEAFLEAGRIGSHMVELDVHLTADGALMVHHDALVPGVGMLAETNAGELPDWIPSLGEVMTACEGMDVNIEIKGLPPETDPAVWPRLAQAVADFVADGGFERRVIVSCFLLATIDAVRAAEPGIPTAWLTGAGWDHHRAVDTAARHGHTAVHPEHRDLTREVIDAAHGAGLAVNTWTCDDPERMRLLADWGVDGIVTNLPDVALEVLATG
jgi:glycerophosphoryl diester phosphodiesterase